MTGIEPMKVITGATSAPTKARAPIPVTPIYTCNENIKYAIVNTILQYIIKKKKKALTDR